MELSSSAIVVLSWLNGAPKAISQREIAHRAHLSVGFINGIIRNLVKRGYVRTCRLNRRSIEYLLTPKGVAQAALRSYRSVLSAVRSYREVHDFFEKLLERLGSEGVSHLYLHGDGELAELSASLIADSGWGEVGRGLPSCISVVAKDKLVCGSDMKNCRVVVLNAAPTPLRKITCRVVDLVQELEMGRLAAVCAE
jgi:DNA-binding MarR family transcriptional regulator